MRLTEEQVRQAFQHPDKDARFSALQYFSGSFSRNPAIMSDVIELIERLGPNNAFLYTFPMADLVQTEETIAWAVKQLQRDHTVKKVDFLGHIGSILCNADPFLVMPHKEQILSSPNLNERQAARLKFRLELVTTPSDEMWKQLEGISEEGKNKNNPNKIPYEEAKELVAALARDHSQADRMMEKLGQEFDPEVETSLVWLENFLVQMAGHMRYEPAIPLLIKKFFLDGEILNEDCKESLTKIGTDEVIRAVRDAYPQAPHHFRLYSAGIFGDIHSDLAVSAGLELMSLEIDFDLRIWLAIALADQFSTEGFDAAQKVLQDDAPYSNDLKSSLVMASKVMNYKVTEAKQWEEEIAESRRPFDNTEALPPDDLDDLDDELEQTPKPPKIKVGRNDPCPCGSGKKFKKCCYGKFATNEEDDDDSVAMNVLPPKKPPTKYPVGTVALYGPDAKTTTKIVAGVIKEEGADAIVERWVGRNVKNNPKVQRQITEFMSRHGVKSVVTTESNFGCPHEEGADFPMGEDCPFCPYWKGKQGSNRRD